MSVLTKGRVKNFGGGGSNFVIIKAGESFTLTPLAPLSEVMYTDLHEWWQDDGYVSHPCIKEECPGCAAGNKTRGVAFLPVLHDGRQKTWKMTKMIYDQVEAIEDSLLETSTLDNPLVGFGVRFSRIGSGLNNTKYNVNGIGSRVDNPPKPDIDILGSIGPIEKDEIAQLLKENGILSEEEIKSKWDFS